MKPLILIDTSYTLFYRFFATIRWYTLAFSDEFKIYNDPKYDWAINNTFMEKYKKMYLQSIINLISKDIFFNSNLIFCMDTPLENLWKTELYCNYKITRKALIKKYNYGNVFKYTYDNLIPQIIQNYHNIKYLQINKIEADDIIGSICLYLKSVDSQQIIYILSGDQDFLQLSRKNIIFINYKTKKNLSLTEDEACENLKKKIIFGDKSDCIEGIFQTGYKIKKKDLLDDEILNNYLNNNLKAKQKYELNKKIIDFNYIPKNLYNKIIKKYLDIFKT